MNAKRIHVDIVVPVYNAKQDVQKCVASVLKHARGDYSLVVVDDKSTDLELVSFLDELSAKHPSVILLRPEKNGGFVQSANLGMKYSVEQSKKSGRQRDVLLLNSDTIVCDEFLERLQDCAYCDERTGIVSPFSNNATICSIPEFCRDNPLPEKMSLREYAAIIASSSLKRRPELVTAVGFCFYIRATVIRQIGFFDPVYGRGFGEENDYCEMAKKAGFRIRLADDVFVAHTGKASFGAEGRALEHKNMKVLLARHPHYLEDVAEFCETNPLLEVQANANFFTKRAPGANFPAILHLIHADPFTASPGGSEHYVLDLVRGMKAPRALVVFPSVSSIEIREILAGEIQDPIAYSIPLKDAPEKVSYQHVEIENVLSQIVDSFQVSVAHLHHFFYWPINVWRVFAERHIPYFSMLHDFYSVCPSHNLFDYSKMESCPCDGSCDVSTRCLQAYSEVAHTKFPYEVSDARAKHREAFDQLLKNAAAVIAPSKKVIELVKERVEVPFTAHVIQHGYDANEQESGYRIQSLGSLRIGILGNINYPNKGAANYLEVVAGTRLADVEWHFFGDVSGFGYEDQLRQVSSSEKLRFHGAYQREQILRLLHEEGIDLVAILPACHETFSFTLSESLIAGIPVLALPMGSLKERLEEAGLQQSLCTSNAQVIERILYYTACRNELSRVATLVRKFRHRSVRECVSDIQSVYGEAGHSLTHSVPSLRPERSRTIFSNYFRGVQSSAKGSAPLVSLDTYRPDWWLPVWRRLGKVSRNFDDQIRRHYFKQRVNIIRSFPFRTIARLCALSPDTELVRERAKVVRFRANGKDPFLVFPEGRMNAASVDCLRLRIRCETPRRPRAQLFWTHHATEGFSEKKSCRIPLKNTARWQDVVVDLRSWVERDRWTEADEIVALRLDPLDCEGYFELEELTFAQFS